MSSIFESSFQKRSCFPSIPTTTKQQATLPISQTDSSTKQQAAAGLRRRLPSFSSLTTTIQQPFSSAASSWVSSTFHRSKISMSTTTSMGGLFAVAGSSSSIIRKWWDWGWAWMLSRKPTFARDLEMDEQEFAMLGSHNRGTLRHVFCKVKTQIRRLGGSDHALPICTPQGFRYDS
ncbi:hypothetical protein BVC80_9085g76 [Macleaya cordata]|uniref:Uncharacterized protein n=1 Tax=Macleaya cordata TaxID=56857 RepID=A0A200PR41_MACCD|nr:hypothetical protein BVC80_9085g76 [Macleaya cordata]